MTGTDAAVLIAAAITLPIAAAVAWTAWCYGADAYRRWHADEQDRATYSNLPPEITGAER